jgi:hypothetical protein
MSLGCPCRINFIGSGKKSMEDFLRVKLGIVKNVQEKKQALLFCSVIQNSIQSECCIIY